jgi:hypothetical protein
MRFPLASGSCFAVESNFEEYGGLQRAPEVQMAFIAIELAAGIGVEDGIVNAWVNFKETIEGLVQRQ